MKTRRQRIKKIICMALAAATLVNTDGMIGAASLKGDDTESVESIVESDEITEADTTEIEVTEPEEPDEESTEESTQMEESAEESTEMEESTEIGEEVFTEGGSEESTEAATEDEAEVLTESTSLGTVQWQSVELTDTTTVTLSWLEVEGAEGYEIYRKSEGGSYTLWNTIEDGTTTSIVDEGTFIAGMVYSYQIRAYSGNLDEDGESVTVYGAYSEEKTICRLTAAPVLTVAKVTYKSVKVSWEKIEDAEGYVIYRKASGDSSYKKLTTIESGTTTAYTDENVTLGVTYYYYAVSFCQGSSKTKYSSNSETVKAKVALEKTVVSLSDIKISSVTVNWNKISGAEGYSVYRAASKDGEYTKIATLQSGKKITYTDTDVKVAKTYYYKVRAYRTVNEKKVYAPYSEVVSTTTCPEAATVSVVSTSYSTIKISWNSVALPSKNCGYYIYTVSGDTATIVGELVKTSTGYDVYRYKKGVRAESACGTLKDVSELSFKITGLTHDKEYQIKVAGYVTKGSGKIIEGADSDTVTATPRLLAVTLESVTSKSYKSAVIAWTSTSDKEDSYRIYRKAEDEDSYKEIAAVSRVDGTTAYSYTDSKLDTGKKYTYKIRSVKTKNADVAYSSYSSKKSVTIRPATTTVKVATNTYNTLKISWSKVKGTESDGYVTGYEIYRSTSKNGTYKKIATVKGGTNTTYTDKSLKTGTKYYYRVKAYCTVKKEKVYSSFSSKASAKVVPAATKISAVTSASYNSISVTWSKVKGTASDGYVTGYEIYRSTSKDSGYKKVATITSGSTKKYKDKNLATGTTYYYKIRAFCTVSKKKIYSAYSNVKSAKVIPATPTINKVSSKNYNTLEISWSKVSGASGYKIYRSTSKDGTYEQVGKVKSGSTLSYQDTRRKTGKKYYYKIKAYTTNSKGENINSKYSEAVSGKAKPEKVKNLKATPQNANRIVLTWSKVSGASSYTIYRSTSKNGTYKQIKQGITDTTYTNSKLKNGQKYYYKVVAVRNQTNGKECEPVSAKAATLDLSETKVTVQQGFSRTVTAGTSPSGNITWSSDNPNIASVNGGVIFGVTEGAATITVRANGITRYISVTVKKTMNGIDVSKWQGEIDFGAVKMTGADFVMIRISHGGTIDPYFEANYANARAAGLLVGVYTYTYATSVEAAVNNAYEVLGMLGGRSLDFPIAYDMEDSSILAATDNSCRTDMAWAFYNTVRGANYRGVLYANLNWLNNAFVNERLAGMDIWIARYRDKSLGHGYEGAGNVIMWQYSSKGSIAGINGNVDLDVAF